MIHVSKRVDVPGYDYRAMMTAIQSALTSGLLAAQKAVEYQRVKTYWQIGRNIRRAIARSGGKLLPGRRLFGRISRDIKLSCGLELSIDTVGRTVQFHKNYPRFPAGTPLTFTHYIALQRMQDPARRLKMERAAINHHLSALDIKAKIARMTTSNSAARPVKKLSIERAEPYIYYVHPQTGLDGTKSMRIDCGFKISQEVPPDNPTDFEQARPVRSIKENGKYRIESYKDGNAKRYTYPASVLHVVDGDTFDVRIDVGFGIELCDRLRLRGIDAPELSSQAGRLAKTFLIKHFTRAPYIVLRTIKAEMYGRWLSDVFTLPGCDDPYKIAAEGEYLNQKLLDKGLAQLYKLGTAPSF